MMEKLGQRDIRALKLGAVGAIAIIVFIKILLTYIILGFINITISDILKLILMQ